MKKYFLGILAVVFALGLSAFNNIRPKAKVTDLYWFKISGTHLPGTSVPSSDASFIQQSASAPSDPECQANTYDCIAGFEQSKVNTSTNTLRGSQLPDNVAALKGN